MSRAKKIWVGAFVLWALSLHTVYAGVIMSEIAWMGTTVSGTNEWIELYNQDAASVDLSGWSIEADDGSPMITLSGSILPGAYFLIERTDDSSVPEVVADLVLPFGNGFGNAGETLRLKNAGGATIDTVVGGTDWANVGGDNTTKETAQRTQNSWITGAPTPREENVAGEGEVLGANTVATTTSGTNGSTAPSGGAVKSPYPRKNIVVEAGEDKRAFVGFPVSFSGSSTGLYNETLPRATYRWNFGDGTASDERNVTHVYDLLGEYVVTLEVFWGEYRSTDRLSVSVSNPDIIISKVVSGERGYVELTNRTDREVDLSGWTIWGGGAISFTFAPNSIILPKKVFILAHRVSGLATSPAHVSLRYPGGSEAFGWGSTTVAGNSRSASNVASPATRTETESKSPAVVLGASLVKPAPSSEPIVTGTSSVAATVLWEGGTQNPLSQGSANSTKWVFAFLVTALIVVAVSIILKSNIDQPTIADEYAIIEDIIEGREDLPVSR